MNNTVGDERMDVLKATKEKLENWPLMKCTDAEKIEWFQNVVGANIAKITLSGDRVEELVVVDELYETAADAMNSMPLPESFPDQENVTRDQLARDYAEYCKQIVIRDATIEQLALPEDTSPEFLFIRPITARMKINSFIDQWDRSMGFTEGLRAMNTPFDYTLEEKKLIFGLGHLMNCFASQHNKMMNVSSPTNANMFKLD